MYTRDQRIHNPLKVLNVQVILSSPLLQLFDGSSLLLARSPIVVAEIQALHH